MHHALTACLPYQHVCIVTPAVDQLLCWWCTFALSSSIIIDIASCLLPVGHRIGSWPCTAVSKGAGAAISHFASNKVQPSKVLPCQHLRILMLSKGFCFDHMSCTTCYTVKTGLYLSELLRARLHVMTAVSLRCSKSPPKSHTQQTWAFTSFVSFPPCDLSGMHFNRIFAHPKQAADVPVFQLGCYSTTVLTHANMMIPLSKPCLRVQSSNRT